jgi:hypothetical protein
MKEEERPYPLNIHDRLSDIITSDSDKKGTMKAIAKVALGQLPTDSGPEELEAYRQEATTTTALEGKTNRIGIIVSPLAAKILIGEEIDSPTTAEDEEIIAQIRALTEDNFRTNSEFGVVVLRECLKQHPDEIGPQQILNTLYDIILENTGHAADRPQYVIQQVWDDITS